MDITEEAEHIHLVTIRYSNELHRLVNGDRTLRNEGFQRAEKVYAVVFPSSDDSEFMSTCKPRFYDLIDQYEHSVTVRLTLPKVDSDSLDRLGIDLVSSSVILPPTATETAASVFPPAARPASPMESYSPDAGSDDSLSHLERERALSDGEEEDEAELRRRRQEDIEEFATGSAHYHGSYLEGDEIVPPLPNSTSSASEDSSSLSLTDSDRTLLGDAPETEEEILDRSFNESEHCSGGGVRRRNALIQDEPEPIKTVAESEPLPEKLKYFFKVFLYSICYFLLFRLHRKIFFFQVISISDEDDEKRCSVMVDKRIPLSAFKSELVKRIFRVSSCLQKDILFCVALDIFWQWRARVEYAWGDT